MYDIKCKDLDLVSNVTIMFNTSPSFWSCGFYLLLLCKLHPSILRIHWFHFGVMGLLVLTQLLFGKGSIHTLTHTCTPRGKSEISINPLSMFLDCGKEAGEARENPHMHRDNMHRKVPARVWIGPSHCETKVLTTVQPYLSSIQDKNQ